MIFNLIGDSHGPLLLIALNLLTIRTKLRVLETWGKQFLSIPRRTFSGSLSFSPGQLRLPWRVGTRGSEPRFCTAADVAGTDGTLLLPRGKRLPNPRTASPGIRRDVLPSCRVFV